MDHRNHIGTGMESCGVISCTSSAVAGSLAPHPSRFVNNTKSHAIPVSCLFYIALGLLSLRASPGWAQVVSPIEASNQEFVREQERSRALRQQQERAPDVHLSREVKNDSVRLRFDESPCFRIDRILLEGGLRFPVRMGIISCRESRDGGR